MLQALGGILGASHLRCLGPVCLARRALLPSRPWVWLASCAPRGPFAGFPSLLGWPWAFELVFEPVLCCWCCSSRLCRVCLDPLACCGSSYSPPGEDRVCRGLCRSRAAGHLNKTLLNHTPETGLSSGISLASRLSRPNFQSQFTCQPSSWGPLGDLLLNGWPQTHTPIASVAWRASPQRLRGPPPGRMHPASPHHSPFTKASGHTSNPAKMMQKMMCLLGTPTPKRR